MEEKEKVNEQLLSAWLRLTTTISNERIVSKMSFNESLVCHILYRHEQQNPQHLLTATDLCEKTKMVKSLMNRTLNSMEAKGMIQRIRSLQDKRHVFIQLNMQAMDLYLIQHAQVLELIDKIVAKFGKEKAREIYEIFETISDIAQEVIHD